jgi:hypothetical protein
MKNSHRNKVSLPLIEAALGLTVLATACTPATPDYTPLSTTGASGGSASNTSTGSPTPGTTGTPSGASTSSTSDTNAGSTTDTNGASTTGTGAGSTTDTNGASTTDTNAGSTTDTNGASTTGTGAGSTTDTNAGSTTAADGGTTTGGTTGTATSQDAGTTTGGDGGAGGCYWMQRADGTWGFDPSAPNKIALFDGTQATFAMWHKENQPTVPIQWTLNADGTMTVVPSGTGMATEVQTDMKFDDLCVHVEYQTPMYPSSVMGQLRGNSGVYLKSAYEMQILDSFGQPAAVNTCGAVYSIMAPLVVACLPNNPPLPWNIYEIEFKGSVWNTAVTPAVKTQNAEFIQCALNGQIVQRNVVVNPAAGFTQAGIPDAPGPQPLGLQDHLDLVSFRNVWARIPQY